MRETLKTDAITEPPSVDEIAEMELKKLNPIYMIVPLNITKCWANKYAKDNSELVKQVNDAYKERYVRLESQHEVAQGILRHKCPLLYATAADEGHLKSIEWKSMRGRLSQNESTTHGRNWLDKMQDLLLNKLNKGKKKGNSYVISDNGDLQLKDGAQAPVTGLVNLTEDPGENSEDNDKVDDDVDEETVKDAGKQEVAVDDSRTAFPSSRTPFLRSGTVSTPSESASSSGRKRRAKVSHRDPSNKKTKVADDGNSDGDSDTEGFSTLWDLSNKSLDTMINELDVLEARKVW